MLPDTSCLRWTLKVPLHHDATDKQPLKGGRSFLHLKTYTTYKSSAAKANMQAISAHANHKFTAIASLQSIEILDDGPGL